MKRILTTIAASMLLASSAFAGDIPLRNWTVPSPAAPHRTIGATVTAPDLTYGMSFVAITPCRVYDSRAAAGGPGPIAGATSRTIDVNYTGAASNGYKDCGVISTAGAYSLNITVTGSAASSSYAFVTAYPTGTVRPGSSTVNFLRGTQVANAAIVPAGTAGDIDIYASSATDVLVDINGYFASTQRSDNGFVSQSTDFYGVAGTSVNTWGIYGSSTNSYGIVGSSNGTASVAGVAGTGNNARGVFGVSTNSIGVEASTTNGTMGAYAHNANVAGTTDSYGIKGTTDSTSSGVAGFLESGVVGIDNAGLVPTLGSNAFSSSGVLGVSADRTAVRGLTRFGSGMAGDFVRIDDTTPYSVLSRAQFATNASTAAVFTGNVTVSGSLSKGSGTFKIDHPLDPENKYLYHSFVESPDMMNIYNGVIELDAHGEATVKLPEYFEALNQDFRYQLTCIGKFAPVYIDSEVDQNTFRIAGGRPGMKVSWQVTGIRHDKFADAHRVIPEVEKAPSEKGTYLHAAEWGHPDKALLHNGNSTPETEQREAAKVSSSQQQ